MNRAGKEKANVVGIFGMGGVGKTTLTKELFNQKQPQYTKASFLFDCREASTRAELPDLQRKLLNDLFDEKDHKFRSLEEGTSCLRDRLERSGSPSFLIVLDDIDHVNQLDALLPMDIINKCRNNLVIVTTRDVGVLVTAGIEIAYHMKGLDREDGKELFCWHAFGQPDPCSGYEDLVEEFVNTCGGLPLSLQVLGRHVRKRDLQYWREELEKARDTLPADIKKRLKISIDSLDKEQKQVFMDVACFFVGKQKTMAMRICEGSGWKSHHALETLKDKCLLEEFENWSFVDRKWEFWRDRFYLRMHDHLRDLGREMANELSPPRRLWHPQHLNSLELKGLQTILAQTKGRCFHSIQDEFMGCQITYFIGETEDVSDTSLLWLQLHYPEGPPLYLNSDINPSIPSWIPLQNLQCLRISGGWFQRLWQTDMQAPSHLKELQIHETFLEEFPDFCQHLQSLKICRMENLFEVDLARIKTLNFLEISHCKKVKRLSLTPDLSKLVELKIDKCAKLEQLPSLARLSSLEQIEIGSCKKIQIITLPTTLLSLSVNCCRCLQRVAVVSDLTKLTNLYINYCPELDKLPSLCRVSCLEQIKIESCEKLQKITLPTTLTSLTARKCRDLQRVTGDLTKLTELCIQECPALEELPSLYRVSYMEEIAIYSCEKLNTIKLPTTLTKLTVKKCRHLQTVTAIGDRTKLTRLVIKECPELEELPSLARVSCFTNFVIDRCEKLQSISGIEELQASTYLKLSHCSNAVIRNCIHKLKREPRSVHMIGRAVDGAVSTLNENLFWDANIGAYVVAEIGDVNVYWSDSRELITCFLVVFDEESSAYIEEIYRKYIENLSFSTA